MTLLGHKEAWAQWRAAMAGARMHHAWILGGKKGLGKATFALTAARELVAEPGVPQPPGEHPDVIVLTNLPASKEDEKKREDGKPFALKRNISIDQIRQMQLRLNTRPTLGSRRVIIIDPADDLEKSACNALLKSLEEPPQGTFFLLVTHRPGRLLPTIRSRCRMLPFRPLDNREMEEVLEREAPSGSPAARTAAIAAAAGSPGAALDFVELDLGPLHTLMGQIAATGDADFKLRGKLADAIGTRPSRERQAAVLDLARTVLAERMATTPMTQVPALVETNADLAQLAAHFPIYNFDPGLLVMEIGTLLAHLAPVRTAG
ncbi:AAA family ATPase [Alteraurantiacibacter buctensis]|uniref:AAA family ATPase n=1 Tax=Alteraurantiacibacter buctensis TaxID=1503981 RepID=A0A844YZG1_9SPHN|nr:AAA family ATPase [Alteraurantiacibacter buctensis]MXO72161.1 AAA family ATPase [Alteraurantiacibacter buctensis]